MKSCTCCNICAVNKFQNLHFPLCSECVKQMNQSVNVLKLLVKKKKIHTWLCACLGWPERCLLETVHRLRSARKTGRHLYNHPRNEVIACAIPADPSVLHTSAVMKLGSPCFHFHVLSLEDSFSACVLHTQDDTAVCCDNPEQIFKYWVL